MLALLLLFTVCLARAPAGYPSPLPPHPASLVCRQIKCAACATDVDDATLQDAMDVAMMEFGELWG